MSAQVYTLLGLTAVVAALVAVVVFAALRFVTAAREATSRGSSGGAESALMTSAIQDAVGRLRDQERQLLARAEASERLSRDIVNSLTSGLMLVGASGEVQLVNPAGRRLLGLGAERDVRCPYRDLLVSAGPLADVIAEALASLNPIIRRTVALDDISASAPPSGVATVTHLGVTVSPVSTAEGDARAVICLFSDLTSVVALEEQIRLKETLARLGELTAGLAHEFRNGLATIHGYAHMLDTSTLRGTQAACIEGLRQETQALGEVVTNFLNFARPAQLALAPIDVGSIARRAADDLGADAARLEGGVRIGGEFATIEGDEVLLRQAFSNLYRNALEACRDAGIAPEVSAEGRLDRPAGVLRVSVADNGPGIPTEALGRIFQPFFTTRNGGTGLGLALVQKIVVTHNGRVTAFNRAGGGALFEVVFPLPAGALTKVSGS